MAQPYSSSLNQFLLDLGLMLDDAKKVTAQSGSTTTFVTTDLGGQLGGDYAGSELYLWTPPSTTNLVLVNDAGVANTLSFSTVGGSGIANGHVGVLQNLNGSGFSQEKKLFATRMAIQEDIPYTQGVVTISTGFDNVYYWQTIPAGVRSITQVYVTRGGQLFEIGPALWKDGIDPIARKISIPYTLTSGVDSIRLVGRVDPAAIWTQASPDLTTALEINSSELLKSAAKWALWGKRDDGAFRTMQYVAQDRRTSRRDIAMHNEVFLA